MRRELSQLSLDLQVMGVSELNWLDPPPAAALAVAQTLLNRLAVTLTRSANGCLPSGSATGEVGTALSEAQMAREPIGVVLKSVYKYLAIHFILNCVLSSDDRKRRETKDEPPSFREARR
jgi:HrpA-like RNA helicase